MFPFFGYSKSAPAPDTSVEIDPSTETPLERAQRIKETHKKIGEMIKKSRTEVMETLDKRTSSTQPPSGFLGSVSSFFGMVGSTIALLGPGRYAPVDLTQLLGSRPTNVILVSAEEINDAKQKLKKSQTIKREFEDSPLQKAITNFFSSRKEEISSENSSLIETDENDYPKASSREIPLQEVSSSSSRD